MLPYKEALKDFLIASYKVRTIQDHPTFIVRYDTTSPNAMAISPERQIPPMAISLSVIDACYPIN